MLVHQIFWDFKGKGRSIKDVSCIFYKCHMQTVEKVKEYGMEYKMWSYEDCELLIKESYKQYENLWNDFKVPMMKQDFIRNLILHKEGGIYIDLDIEPIKDFTELFEEKQFWVIWSNDKRKLPYNALRGSHKGNDLMIEIANHSQESYYVKSKMPIYSKWKGRLVFQTTGHFAVNRVLKKHKIIGLDIININKNGKLIEGKNPYFTDYNANLWDGEAND
tara:strand:- start:308 stop:964 length:657 start_codon:yes stop_codon:yes gene_type:complete